MRHLVEVNDIRLYAYHGCMEEEGKVGGKYTLDVQIETDFTAAAKEDNLSKTVDYVAVYNIVKEEMAIRSKLIETVGQRIVERLKNEVEPIFRLRVKVKKLCPPLNGDVENTAIIIEENGE